MPVSCFLGAAPSAAKQAAWLKERCYVRFAAPTSRRHCRNEALRKQLKALLAAVEQSSQAVLRYREQLQAPKPTVALGNPFVHPGRCPQPFQGNLYAGYQV